VEPRTFGNTSSGEAINDQHLERLTEKAEAGYDIEATLKRRSGGPKTGSAADPHESPRRNSEPGYRA
jgi:hypothetical protein